MANIHTERLRQFQQLLAANRIDGYLVTRREDQCFLTGYFMDGYHLLIGRKKAWALVPKMLHEQFQQVAPFYNAVATDTPLAAAHAIISAEGLRRLAFDPEAETYASGCALCRKGFAEKGGLAASLRETKMGAEIADIAKACKIAVKAFAKLKPEIKPGMTENQVRARLQYLMDCMGAQGPSFALIIGSGPNSALPHHSTSERKIRDNEALLLDFGCKYNNYCSDYTRTFFIGKPTDEFKKVHGIVQRSHDAGIKAVRAGAKCIAVDKVCRDLIVAEGYGDKFIHGTGHGLGLEIHEFPRLNQKCDATLKEGMAVTVEPGIYLHGKFGVRIEDTVLVTKTGCKILTK